MEEQVFLEFDLRFNLRQSKHNKPTIIYAVFTCNGKQTKINTNVKVYPSQWNRKRQIATISNGQTRLDNNNNRIVNETIKKIGIVFEEQKHYLCENIDEINNIFNLMRKSINPKYKERMKKNNEPLATFIMADFASSFKESTARQYRTIVSAFKKFIDENGISNRLSSMNYDTLKSYQDCLCSEGLSINTINDRITILKSLLKKISISKKYDYKYANSELDELRKIDDTRTRVDRRSKQVALTENEILRLYSLNELKSEECEYRDLFCLQCWTGQRVSDVSKLFDRKYYMDDNTISFKNHKTKEEVVIKLDIDGYYIKDILNKYGNEGFHYVDIENLKAIDDENNKNYRYECAKYNKVIRTIGEKAQLNQVVEFIEQRGTKIVAKTDVYWRLIHSHTARHSYITNMLRRGISREIIKITTGHTSDKMIDEIYQHLTKGDKANKLHKGMNVNNAENDIPQPEAHKRKIEVIETVPPQNGVFTTLVNSVEEAKKVLNFLGADVDEYIETDDINVLLEMIGFYHTTIRKKYGSIICDVKEIFNKYADPKMRKQHLHNLLKRMEAEKQSKNLTD